MSKVSRRSLLRGAAAAAVLAPAAALPLEATAGAAPIAQAALAEGPVKLKGWSMCYVDSWRKHPLTVYLSDGGQRFATDEESRRFLLRHPLDYQHFTPARLRSLLPVEHDGRCLRFSPSSISCGSPATMTRPPKRRASSGSANGRLQTPFSAYRARTDAGAAEQLQIVLRATYGYHEDDGLTAEQKRGLLNSAISWLWVGLCNGMPLESRQRERRPDVPEKALANEMRADPDRLAGGAA